MPNSLCPKDVNNKSVKVVQGDMMFCPSCDVSHLCPNVTDNVTAVPHDEVKIEADKLAKLGSSSRQPMQRDNHPATHDYLISLVPNHSDGLNEVCE